MQPLTASPRTELTDDQVQALLTGDEVEFEAGLELLDADNRFVADISGVLVAAGSKVSHDGRGQVHGACSLRLQQRLAWGRDRVRPYLTVSNHAVSARFNLGVYVLTTPREKRGETPTTYDVVGHDLLQLLATNGPGDTYVVDPEPGADIIDNPEFATDTTGWESSAAFGAYTPATSFPRVTTSPWAPGTPSMKVTWPNEGAAGQSWVDTHVPGLVIGKTYKLTAVIYVPTGGPDDFHIDIVFRASSPWVTPPKDTLYTIEWLWTCTHPDVFPGLATRDCTAGQETYVRAFHMEPLSTTCLDAVAVVLDQSGAGAALHIDGTEQVAVLPGPMVWAMTDGVSATWLDIVNDLLGAVNYVEVYADHDGNFRSEPYLDPATRSEQWTFDTADQSTNIVGPDREVEQDLWGKPNWWRFIRRGMATTPVEGDGMYTVQNYTKGLSSQVSLERVVRRPPVFLDAVDQTSLEAQGDRTVVEDTASARTISVMVDPLPHVGHLDVVKLLDAGESDRALVLSSETLLDGGQGRWVLESVT